MFQTSTKLETIETARLQINRTTLNDMRNWSENRIYDSVQWFMEYSLNAARVVYVIWSERRLSENQALPLSVVWSPFIKLLQWFICQMPVN